MRDDYKHGFTRMYIHKSSREGEGRGHLQHQFFNSVELESYNNRLWIIIFPRNFEILLRPISLGELTNRLSQLLFSVCYPLLPANSAETDLPCSSFHSLQLVAWRKWGHQAVLSHSSFQILSVLQKQYTNSH